MSQENLELVDRLVEAFNRRDFEAIVALCDPGVELVEDPRVPGAITRRGRAEVQRYFESMHRYWEAPRIEPERFVDRADEVLVLARLATHTRRGGPEMERRVDLMVTLRADKVVRGRWFVSRQEALEAAGLSSSG